MHQNDDWYDWAEKVTDWLIPPAILALGLIIIIELFFHDVADTYHTAIQIADVVIIGIFVVDLFFKYNRARTIKHFLKTSWLDIIAVFPFFLIFRIAEPLVFIFGDVQKEVKNVQLIFHESLEISKSTSKIVKETEAAGKLSRTRALTAMFRAFGRAPRFLKAVPFFEKPTGRKKK